MIERDLQKKLKKVATLFPAITLTGPRQSGKSTLCRHTFPDKPLVNFESPDSRATFMGDPRGFLAEYPDGAIFDEFQRCPEIPSYLMEMIDNDPKPGRWILTGSQNLSVINTVKQSLAGRTAVLRLLPLTYNEVTRFENHPTDIWEAVLTGGYPRIFDAQINIHDWFQGYVATYLDRDVQSVKHVQDLSLFQTFVKNCAGRTASLLNYSSLANDCGISQTTVKSWISILEATFIAYRLPSFRTNIRKRLVKMPKLHFYDSGLVCWLLGIQTAKQLKNHPLKGPIFETWVVSEISKQQTNQGENRFFHFFRDQNGMEIDVVLERGMGLTLAEVKATQTSTPDLYKQIWRVRDLLGEKLKKEVRSFLIYGGDKSHEMRHTKLLPWNKIGEENWANWDPN